MLNNYVGVGRLYSIPRELISIPKDHKVFEIKIPRINGDAIDIIPCITTNTISDNMITYTKVEDVIGIKGSIRIIDNTPYVYVDKVTFLSSSKIETYEGGE